MLIVELLFLIQIFFLITSSLITKQKETDRHVACVKIVFYSTTTRTHYFHFFKIFIILSS